MKGLQIMQAGSYKVKGTGSNGYAVKSASPDVPVMPIGISQISSEKCGKNNHDLYSCSIKSTQALVHNGSSILNGESTAAVKLSVSPNPAINLSLFNFCYDYFADVYFDKPGVKEKLIS